MIKYYYHGGDYLEEFLKSIVVYIFIYLPPLIIFGRFGQEGEKINLYYY